jgi:uncharacterized membrane protein
VLTVKPTRWVGIILLFTLLTLAIVCLIPSNSALSAIRYAFGFVFVVFLPGYCLVNILFLGANRLDPVEIAVLSVALSFGVTGLVGLFLGLSIGMNFTSITVSLTGIVLGLAVVAFLRKSRVLLAPQPQPLQQGSN